MALTYEVNQIGDRFRWFVKEDGEIVDSWGADGEDRSFRTEAEALEFLAAEYPDATDFHTYMSPERDAEIKAWADEVNAAAEGNP